MQSHLSRGKRSFTPYKNENDSEEAGGKGQKKKIKVGPKMSIKILFHSPPGLPCLQSYDSKSFPKISPTEIKHSFSSL